MRIRKSFGVGAAALALLAVAAPSFAQGGGGAPGGMQFTPEQQAKFKKLQQFQANHKNYRSIQQSLYGIAECQKNPATKLTKDQAKKILAVIKQWEAKPALTNEQAGQVNKLITAGLTTPQIKTVATTQMPFGRGRAGGGGAGGGQGRPGGAAGGPPANFQIPDPKEYNPLNPATLPFVQFRDMAKQRMNDFKTKLAAAAK